MEPIEAASQAARGRIFTRGRLDGVRFDGAGARIAPQSGGGGR